MTRTDVTVVGGGIAGLAAATYLARAGKSVKLCERSGQLGGRARSQVQAGFSFNLGPHALYAHGAARRVLDELGVPWSGSIARGTGGLAIREGRAHTLPIGFVSLLTTGLLSLADKLAGARLLAAVPRIELDEIDPAMSFADWVEARTHSPALADLLRGLLRVSTYTHAADRVPARTGLAQLQLAAAGGVYYLDGGWQTLVDGLEQAARDAGVAIETGRRIEALSAIESDAVVLAVSPAIAGRLLGRSFDRLTSVRAACLDLALTRLPRPRVSFALGLDRPHYFSVHTRYARLAPEGGEVIHVAKYLEPGTDSDPTGDRAELEELCDLVQPGWRDELIEARFMPGLTVSNAMPGPRPAIDQGGGIYLAGDWVGDEGLLADAALASARAAARAIAGERLAIGEAHAA